MNNALRVEPRPLRRRLEHTRRSSARRTTISKSRTTTLRAKQQIVNEQTGPSCRSELMNIPLVATNDVHYLKRRRMPTRIPGCFADLHPDQHHPRRSQEDELRRQGVLPKGPGGDGAASSADFPDALARTLEICRPVRPEPGVRDGTRLGMHLRRRASIPDKTAHERAWRT